MSQPAPLRSIVIAPGKVEPKRAPTDAESIDSPGRWLVLATLFLVTGALGLPLLWRCREFSAATRWIWSAVVSLYTVALFVAVGLVVKWSLTSIAD